MRHSSPPLAKRLAACHPATQEEVLPRRSPTQKVFRRPASKQCHLNLNLWDAEANPHEPYVQRLAGRRSAKSPRSISEGCRGHGQYFSAPQLPLAHLPVPMRDSGGEPLVAALLSLSASGVTTSREFHRPIAYMLAYPIAWLQILDCLNREFVYLWDWICHARPCMVSFCISACMA